MRRIVQPVSSIWMRFCSGSQQAKELCCKLNGCVQSLWEKRQIRKPSLVALPSTASRALRGNYGKREKLLQNCALNPSPNHLLKLRESTQSQSRTQSHKHTHILSHARRTIRFCWNSNLRISGNKIKAIIVSASLQITVRKCPIFNNWYYFPVAKASLLLTFITVASTSCPRNSV